MRYNKLGRSGLLVSELCLGTMTFGGAESGGRWSNIGSTAQSGADEIIKAAFDAGVNFIDTADVYANGHSEIITGQALKNLKLPRDEMVIATKGSSKIGNLGVPPGKTDAENAEIERRAAARNLMGNTRKHLFDAIDASLKRLQVDYIDLYQLHGDDPLTSLEETMDALTDIVRSGRARYIGLCNFPAWRTAKALGISERKNLPRFEAMQMYYSIGGRELEREVAPLAMEEGLAILPWSPLASGFFTGKFTRDNTPADARWGKGQFPAIELPRGYDIVETMKNIGDAQGASVAQVALAWLLHKPYVPSVIFGARTLEQAKDNFGAVKVKLNAEEMKTLDDLSALRPEYPGWMLARQGGARAVELSPPR